MSWKTRLETMRRLMLADAEKHRGKDPGVSHVGCALIYVGPDERGKLDSLPARYSECRRLAEFGWPAEGGSLIRILLSPWCADGTLVDFASLSSDAGKILREAPAGTVTLPEGFVDGGGDLGFWVQLIMASQPRKFWQPGGTTLPWNAAELRGLSEVFGIDYPRGLAVKGEPPDYWLVEVDDVFRVSVDAVDRLCAESGDAVHGVDFRSVYWFGTEYSFTPKQAACVKILWQAWENKTPEMDFKTVLACAEDALSGEGLGKQITEGARLVDTFKNHPAWGTMIVPGETKGSVRLRKPK